MSKKTKAELEIVIQSLRQQLKFKDEYIDTLEYLLSSEERDSKALRAAHEKDATELAEANKGRVIAEMNRFKKRALLAKEFLYYITEVGIAPEAALKKANQEVAENDEFKKGYEKSSLYAFRKEFPFSKYFPR